MPAQHEPPRERRSGAVYRRVSSPAQGEEERHSLEAQQAIGRGFAETHQIDVEWDDYDDTTSKHGIEYLPKLDSLMQLAEDGEFDVIIIDKLDRLTRAGQGDYWDAIRRLTNAEVRLFAVTDNFDSWNRDDLLRGDLNAYSAEKDNTNRTINTVRGRRDRVTKNHWPNPGRAAPYGWQWVDPYPTAPKQPTKTKLQHNLKEAPYVQWMYSHLDAGGTLYAAAQYLNDNDAPRRGDGDGWNSGQVREVVMNSAQWGVYYAFRYVTADWTPREKREYRKTHGGKKPKHLRHRYDLLYGSEDDKRKAEAVLALRYPAGDAPRLVTMPGVLVDEPLVDEPKAKRVIATFADNKAHAAANVRSHTPDDALFTGHEVRCAYCGRGLAVTRRSEFGDKRGRRRLTRPWRYVCSRGGHNAHPCPGGGVAITCTELDVFTWDTVCRAIRDEDFLRRLIAKTDAVTKPALRAEQARRELKDHEEHKRRWLKKIEKLNPDDPHYAEDEEDYRHEMHARDPQIAAAKERLQRAEDELAQEGQRRQVLDEFHQYATEHREHLDDLTAEQRRDILKHLRVQLHVGAEHLTARKRRYKVVDDAGHTMEMTPARIAMYINLAHHPEAVQHLNRLYREYGTYDADAWYDDDINRVTWAKVIDGTPEPENVIDLSVWHETCGDDGGDEPIGDPNLPPLSAGPQ